MPVLYGDRTQAAAQHGPASWQRVVLGEFEAQMASEARPFPCTFGVAGFRLDHLRYLFLDPYDIAVLGQQLTLFLREARSFGPNTSLVVFTRPRPVQTLDAYYRKFWLTLDQLARLDGAPWPDAVSRQVDDPAWEFCFGGEPIFVVCNTPAHTLRQSRRSTSFMLTFQPRWVFEKILGTEQAAAKAFGQVRARLAPYDAVAPSPALGRYGDPTVREYRQYFLFDDNGPPPACPFARLAQGASVRDGERGAEAAA